MEINKLEDLIPYQRSLAALWDREEFQPVLGLLNRLKEEAISWARFDATAVEAENVKAASTRISTQLRIVELFIELPERLTNLAKTAEQNKTKLVQMKNTVEGGEL
jgi:hypothetical protein